VGRQRGGKLQVADLVIAAFKAHRFGRLQQTLDDAGVLHQPHVTVIMGREIVKGSQIVLESPATMFRYRRRP